MFAQIFARTKTFLFDTLFPVSCLGCHKEFDPSTWLCGDCFGRLKRLHMQIPQLSSDEIDALYAAADYADPVVESVIHQLKYNFIWDLARPCADLIVEMMLKSPELYLGDGRNTSDVVVMPIPLHRRRLNERGFNQAQLIAVQIARVFGYVCFDDVLVRTRYTTSQKSLAREARLTNLEGAFACREASRGRLAGKTVILVDDVVTTGATLRVCAQAARGAGAARVIGVAVAGQQHSF